METTHHQNIYSFLKGGGEMGELTRTFNWSLTTVGNPDQWPQSLRTTVSNMLRSKFPMFLWWGKEMIQFYNDAYRPSLGNEGKHPAALGAKGEDTWPEIWHIISPLHQQVENTGEATWMENQLVPIYRNGHIEDVYWTYSYSSVLDDDGNHNGILVTCMETTEEVFSHKKIEKSQQELLQLFEESPVAIAKISKDDDLVFEYANSFYAQLVGRKRDEIVGRPLLEALPEMKGQGFDDLLKEVIRSAKPFIATEVSFDILRQKKIETRYVNLIYQPHIEPDETIGGVLVVATDVTEQVKARKKVEESEVKYRTLFESMDQAYCTLEIIFEGNKCVDYRYLETNPSFDRHLGMSNALGKTIREIAPDIEPKWFDFYEGVALTGKPIRIVEESRAFNKWFEVFAVRIGSAEDRKVGVFFTDITERKRAEEAINQSENNLRNVILQAPVAMAILKGPSFVVEIANDRMFELWGRGKEELLNNPLFEKLPEVKDQGYEELLNNVFTTGERFVAQGIPVTLPRKEGVEIVFTDLLYEAFREVDGTIAGVMAVAIDVTDQVLAKRKIEENEAKLRSILNSTPTAIGVFAGPDLIVENPNQLMIEVMAAGSDIEGKSFRKLLSGLVEGEHKFLDLVDGVRTTGKPFEAQEVEVFFKAEKKTRYFNISFIPLSDANGEIYAVLDVSVDVTEQVLARKKIEENEGRFRLLADASPNLVWMLNSDGSYAYVNKTTLSFLNITQQQIAAVGWAPYQHPDDLELVTEAIKKAVQNQHPYEMEHRLLHKDGGYRWVLSQALPAYDINGNVFAFVGSSIDIDEAKKGKQQLETVLEQVRLSKEAAELGTFDLDLEDGNMHWDDRCRTLFGISHKHPVTYETDFVEGLHPEDRDRILEVIDKAFIKSVSNGDYDVEYRTVGAEDGVVRWVRAKGKVYFNSLEKPVRFIGSVLDITEQVATIQKIESLVQERTKELAAANESLLQANKELRRSNDNLEEFTYAASHDLKEPIRKINIFSNQLKDHLKDRLTERENNIFGRILNATERMGILIEDLLLYSHVTERPRETELIDLNQKIQRVLEDLELDIEEKHATIKVDKLPSINGYRRQLQQLFQNLITNALKYSKAGVPPFIYISASDVIEQGKLYHVISIKDNGIGFEEKYADKIFHMFTRLHGKAEYSGTGVGLSIVKRVIENHNGFIKVESKPGVGSTFSIFLPA